MERDLWVEKENSTKETINDLNGNISGLQTQVMELEESKNYLLHDNQRLEENFSGLKFQIQNLEERVTSAVSSSATRTANDLYLKPDSRGVANNEFPDAASESPVEISKQFGNADSTTKFTETTPASTDRKNISKDILIQDERNIAEDRMERVFSHVINSLSDSSQMTSLPCKTIGLFEDVAFRSEGEDNRILTRRTLL